MFKPITFYKESTGICRYDFFDWGKQIDTVMLAKPQGGSHDERHQRHPVGQPEGQ